MLDLHIKPPEKMIGYHDNIMVVGSCFTEHIGGRLKQLKFSVLQNPNGILFDPISVSNSLLSYVENKQYASADLFHLNELWQSWQHHSMFSGLQQEEVVLQINRSQQQAHNFLHKAKWLIITLGSSFSYRLTTSGVPVANCHRAPAQWFQKHLLGIEEIVTALSNTIGRLIAFNSNLNIIFTVSPVRHIRDGVIENNRSKARLIEAVHQLVSCSANVYYFPAYELVIDVLRDYRFYDIDMVHPNYAATEFVFEKFTENFLVTDARLLAEEVKNIVTAFHHKPSQPQTIAHKNFLSAYLKKIQHFQQNNPHIDFSNEIRYFSDNGPGDQHHDAF